MNLPYDASGLTPGAHAYIRAHIDAIREINPPGPRWSRWDVGEAPRWHLRKLRVDGPIEVAVENAEGHNLYVTTEQAWAVIQAEAENRTRLLCGHGGIRNIGGGFYECTGDSCDHRYTRDTPNLLVLQSNNQ